MTTYKELLKQREALEQQISEARRRELSDAISQVRSLVAEFGLTSQDVFPTGRARSASAAGAAAVPGFSVQAATPAVRPTSAAVLMKLRRPRPPDASCWSFLSIMVYLFRLAQ